MFWKSVSVWQCKTAVVILTFVWVRGKDSFALYCTLRHLEDRCLSFF